MSKEEKMCYNTSNGKQRKEVESLSQSFLKKKIEEPELPARRPVEVVESTPEFGLTASQVRAREMAGWVNTPVDPPSKTTKQIVLDNTFTYFNLIFFILALAVIAVQQWLNLTFMGVIIVNTLIGIYQELKAKETLSELSILAAPKAQVCPTRSGRCGGVFRRQPDLCRRRGHSGFGPCQ